MANGLNDRQWQILLSRIQDGNCTPMIGFGACAGALPSRAEMAARWAEDNGLPVEACGELHRVAQFLAVDDPVFPKEDLVRRWYRDLQPPDFGAADQPHALLADLPLPVYITTNYDDFMAQALENRHRDPRREICRWKAELRDQPSVFDTDFSPTPANPVVFHLYGQAGQAGSLVLTEDDYLDFLVNISRDQELLPPRIQQALNGSSLIFLGYDLSDLDFRVLFRGLVASFEGDLRRISVTVQMPAAAEDSPAGAAQRQFLEEYFSNEKIGVYWGTAGEFAAELRRRCGDAGILR